MGESITPASSHKKRPCKAMKLLTMHNILQFYICTSEVNCPTIGNWPLQPKPGYSRVSLSWAAPFLTTHGYYIWPNQCLNGAYDMLCILISRLYCSCTPGTAKWQTRDYHIQIYGEIHSKWRQTTHAGADTVHFLAPWNTSGYRFVQEMWTN